MYVTENIFVMLHKVKDHPQPKSYKGSIRQCTIRECWRRYETFLLHNSCVCLACQNNMIQTQCYRALGFYSFATWFCKSDTLFLKLKCWGHIRLRCCCLHHRHEKRSPVVSIFQKHRQQALPSCKPASMWAAYKTIDIICLTIKADCKYLIS